ncbi:hypothetical protein POSPLADRAFT_1043689 [Postia placenta MAD-698-R-SB12]|uniref:Uncharacterized protein n=1 Tax=Postia placenta MAD-698-R-SB12 TaxID=670580 RepID=A0A1X6NCH5_9APHY|nr:hypothetical protein POSPLADRAFT_1043689 [Postia placenta MAD-698-R-SB12]OSX66220.1 hypothetical protein POSPLADRAFT_1043689 [Postia placenta MAD-698-R-SB12]
MGSSIPLEYHVRPSRSFGTVITDSSQPSTANTYLKPAIELIIQSVSIIDDVLKTSTRTLVRSMTTATPS